VQFLPTTPEFGTLVGMIPFVFVRDLLHHETVESLAYLMRRLILHLALLGEH